MLAWLAMTGLGLGVLGLCVKWVVGLIRALRK